MKDIDSDGDPASDACTYPEYDCDDANQNMNPGHAEVPGNGMDDNCNSDIFFL